jgi:predicted alpha/beta-hydrolase family hydrolase
MEILPIADGGVSGELHIPERADGRGLVLTHGAGGNCRAPLLLQVAAACAARGLHVLRCDLPFRQRRRSGPPSPATAAADRQGLRQAVQYLRRRVSGPVFLGGHSYGGRQASMLAAEDTEIATALLLFSYPLHPPGKPERLRTGHFPALRVPAIFVHGTADSFGTIAELKAALSLIPTESRLMAVEGAGHDLRRGRFDLAPALAALLDRRG